jgi:methionyl-tRNA formyltransferase
VSYAHKIEKAEAAIDWRLPAAAIARRVRAFNPFPGATAQMGEEVIKLWRAHEVTDDCAEPDASHHARISTLSNAAPGTVLSANEHGVQVCCGEGVLCVTELQRAGGKRLPAAEFLRGFALQPGQTFALPHSEANP